MIWPLVCLELRGFLHDFQYSTILGKSSFLPILCFIEHSFYINFSFCCLVWIGQEWYISSFCFSLFPGLGRGRVGERHLTDYVAGRWTGRAEVSQLARPSSFQHKSFVDFQWHLLSGSQAKMTNQAKLKLCQSISSILCRFCLFCLPDTIGLATTSPRQDL